MCCANQIPLPTATCHVTLYKSNMHSYNVTPLHVHTGPGQDNLRIKAGHN